MTAFVPSERRQRGFTLIELLVVIAIIALLAAILFPVFAQAREKARQTTCISNLKQVGLGLLQYSQDSDEVFPLDWFGNNHGPFPDGTCAGFTNTDASCYKWMDAIYPNVKSEAVFNCPDEIFGFHYFPGDTSGFSNNNGYKYLGFNIGSGGCDFGSYGINRTYFGGTNGVTCPAGSSLALIADPAGTVFAADSQDYSFGWSDSGHLPVLTTSNGGDAFKGVQGTLSYDNLIVRHNGRASVLYCDGHAKAPTINSLLLKNSKGILYNFTNEDDAGL